MPPTAQKILDVLDTQFLASPLYILNNMFVYPWESDYLAVTQADYVYEIEVKVTHSDFLQDFSKKAKHKALSDVYAVNHRKWDRLEKETVKRECPNYFYYATLEGVIRPEEVPEYAGLLWVYPENRWIRKAKEAPRIHGGLLKRKQLNLEYKMYRKMDKLRREAAEARRGDSTRKAVEAMRRGALDAFSRQCPACSFHEGLPICTDRDVPDGPAGSRDCLLQCPRGMVFKKFLP